MLNRTKQSIFSSIRAIDKHVWNSLNIHNKIPLTYEYLQAFEAAPPEGMMFRYLVFYEHGTPCGIGIFQVIKIRWKMFAKTFRSTRDLHPRRGLYVLMCGNSSISGEYGFSFLPEIDRQMVFGSLAKAVKAVKKGLGLHRHVIGAVIKDILPDPDGAGISAQGFYQLILSPNMIVPNVKQWDTFDAYLAAMKGKYRRRTKSVLKKGSGIARKSLSYEEIRNNRERIYALYMQVHARAGFRIITLNPGIFEAWKQALGEAFVLEAYYYEKQMIGFTTRFIGEDHIEGYTHGIDYDYNKRYELYQNMLLDDIKVGIEKRASTISYGRTSVAMKSSVGAVPQEMMLLVGPRNPLYTHFKKRLVGKLVPPSEHCRSPFVETVLS